MSRPTLKAACLALADEIESGALVPGREVFTKLDDVPCCTLGHLGDRVLGDAKKAWDLVPERWRDERFKAIGRANDRGDWPEVVRLLREVANAR